MVRVLELRVLARKGIVQRNTDSRVLLAKDRQRDFAMDQELQTLPERMAFPYGDDPLFIGRDWKAVDPPSDDVFFVRSGGAASKHCIGVWFLDGFEVVVFHFGVWLVIRKSENKTVQINPPSSDD